MKDRETCLKAESISGTETDNLREVLNKNEFKEIKSRTLLLKEH